MKSKKVVDYLKFVHRKKKTKELLGNKRDEFERSFMEEVRRTIKSFGWRVGKFSCYTDGPYDNLHIVFKISKKFPRLEDDYRMSVHIQPSYPNTEQMFDLIGDQFNEDIEEMFHLQCVGLITHDDMVDGVYNYYTKKSINCISYPNEWGITEFRFDDSKYPHDYNFSHPDYTIRKGRINPNKWDRKPGFLPTFSEAIKNIETLLTEHVF